MKVNKPAFAIRVMIPKDISLGDYLENELSDACSNFLTKNGSNDLIERAKQLAINQRIAFNHYMTGIKIQNFANSAAINDTITLQEEINDFEKKFNKATK